MDEIITMPSVRSTEYALMENPTVDDRGNAS